MNRWDKVPLPLTKMADIEEITKPFGLPFTAFIGVLKDVLEENDQDGNFRCHNNIGVVLQLLDAEVVSNRHVRPHCRPFETII